MLLEVKMSLVHPKTAFIANMSRETTPTKQWADELEQPRTSPNDSVTPPKIPDGWKRQLLLHAERSKKQAEKELEKKKKIDEWRSEEKKKVLEAKASPDKAPSPVHSPFHAGRGTSPTARTMEHREPRADTQRQGSAYNTNARTEQRQHNNNRQYEHSTRGQHSDKSPSDKYAPSRRAEVESERWSRGGHAPAPRGRGSRGRGEWRNTRHSPARDAEPHDSEAEHVDVESRDTRNESSTRASASTRARVRHDNEVAVLVVNVELEDGAQTQLVIHERDELSRVARDFCKEHVIDQQLVDLFVKEIAGHLQQVSL